MTALVLHTEGDTTVVVSRWFAAPPAEVYRAHTEPALLQQWCLGPDGWTMPVCICEPRAGGQIRYEWRGDGGGFHLTGNFELCEPPHRLVHVERMHLPDPTPDNRVETTFTDERGGTRMVMRMSVPDRATRDAMLASGMEHGMEIGYQRLDRNWG